MSNKLPEGLGEFLIQPEDCSKKKGQVDLNDRVTQGYNNAPGRIYLSNYTGLNLRVKQLTVQKSGSFPKHTTFTIQLPYKETILTKILLDALQGRQVAFYALRDLVEEGSPEIVNDDQLDLDIVVLCQMVVGGRDRSTVELLLRACLNQKYKAYPKEYVGEPNKKIRPRISPEDCLKQHGSHLDDGGFMIGFCKRCGECLG